MSNGKGMGNQKRLTPKQLKFALLIVAKGERMTGAECAIEAGYSEKAANQTASNLQSLKMFPLVVEEIDRLRKEWQEKYKVSYSRHIKIDFLVHFKFFRAKDNVLYKNFKS